MEARLVGGGRVVSEEDVDGEVHQVALMDNVAL
jgi:hypothetical protein